MEAIMRKLRLNERWISLSMHCMSSVKYHVVVNGNVSEDFIPKRRVTTKGLIIPIFFFLFCSE